MQEKDVMLGMLKLMIKTSGINSLSRTSYLWLRFKLEKEGMINGIKING
jgi:hypothetical protein